MLKEGDVSPIEFGGNVLVLMNDVGCEYPV